MAKASQLLPIYQERDAVGSVLEDTAWLMLMCC
jgi:hypothetical protein